MPSPELFAARASRARPPPPRRGWPAPFARWTPSAFRPSDLVNRRFTASRSNQLWVADLTYIRTWSGWAYVAFVLDAYSRMIVGWQLATHMRTDLPLDALEMAAARHQEGLGSDSSQRPRLALCINSVR
ncbi:DDE-type integrase/transposase/recombinase [Streptomyces sp. NBC_01462]|uniref:DDE-type integrase/transposase/recombinase n=1 Tax=Streptomyces sp. NBC_01462 TaxID=2903876 RepID=UPI003FCD6CC4